MQLKALSRILDNICIDVVENPRDAPIIISTET